MFAKAVAEVEEALRPYLPGSLAERLGGGNAPPSGEVPSPVVSFGLSVVLARLWRMYGVRPAAYVGEGGPGLWAAAYLSRTCSWEAALDGLDAGRGPAAETPPTASTSGLIHLPAIPAPDGEPDSFVRQLGEAFVAGVRLDWAGVYAGLGARRVPLPTYAFRQDHHWSFA